MGTIFLEPGFLGNGGFPGRNSSFKSGLSTCVALWGVDKHRKPTALRPSLLVSCSPTFLVSLLLYCCPTFLFSYSPALLLSCSLPSTLYSLLSILHPPLSTLYALISTLYSVVSSLPSAFYLLLYTLYCSTFLRSYSSTF